MVVNESSECYIMAEKGLQWPGKTKLQHRYLQPCLNADICHIKRQKRGKNKYRKEEKGRKEERKLLIKIIIHIIIVTE